MKKIHSILTLPRLHLLLVIVLVWFLLEVFWLAKIWGEIDVPGKQGRFNLLILGVGGAGHEASDLTDAIMVVLTNQKSNKILLVSLPRDIWIEPYQTKINSLYHYGGFELSTQEVAKVVGQPMNKVLLVDFAVFKEIIDFVGGIDVNVERTFDDYYYPILGKEDDECGGDPKLSCRYEHLHFEAGWQAMTGQQALKFVRSRHAQGEEGTDFARNARQQKVILALKNKIFSPEILGDPKKLWGLWQIIGKNIKTDISQKNFLPLAKFFFPFWHGVQLENIVLNGGALGGKGLLYHPQYHPSGQWVLLPVGGNWERVREFIGQQLAN